MKDLTTISTDLFNKVRSRFSKIKLGDAESKVITDPTNARFFDLDYTHDGKSLGHVNIKIDEKSLTIIYNESMIEGNNAEAKKDWYDFLKELRMFAKSNLLNFDTRDITKTNLDKRDYEYLAQENGDMKMSESKLWGTSKTSYQDVGEAKIIVKHSQPVNYNLPAGRTMHIDSIYIESANGERFRYPHRHLNGARAMAVHIANGGTSYDGIGTYISGLSEELAKLRHFKNYTQRNGLSEALSDVSEKVIDRISSIKEEIAKLQKQSYYSEFKEGYKPYQSLPIPEETINQWVDALTIKTFNEELKNVFPYIYRLVDQPAELGYEDLVGEGKVCDACEKDPCQCDEDLEEHNHLENFEQHLDDITTFEYDVRNPETTQPAPKQAPNAREVVEFIMSMYDQEQGTFPKGEEGVKIAVEKRFGDHAGQFASQVVERLSAKEQAQQGPDFESMQGAIQEAADAATVGELEAAIKKFQQAAGITVDGKFGPATQKAMQAAKAQQPAQAAPAQAAPPAQAQAPAAPAQAPAQTAAPAQAPAAKPATAPAQAATPAPAQSAQSTNTSVSGTIKMGKPEGPIQFNGKTVNPTDPQYAAASQALIQQQQKMQQAKSRGERNVEKNLASSGAPVQQGAANADPRDF